MAATRDPKRAPLPLLTPDRRYIIIRGRLWRATNPNLSPERHALLVRELMDARRAVGRAKQAHDPAAEAIAHAAVQAAKLALGERGAPWWDDGAPDLNRHMARTTDYAQWLETQASSGANAAFIGTAGWSIPKPVAEAVSGAGTHLERYAVAMTGVEINSSFYKPHRRASYARWASSTPDHFRFSVKLPKEISHTRKLLDPDEPLDAFVAQIAGLGPKLGVVLLQLPPSLIYDRSVASVFFAKLRLLLGPEIGIASEPRHASWFTEQADACLVEHHVARVAADPVLAPGGERPGGWTGLRYRRLHGSPHVYYSAYDAPFLASLANDVAGDHCAGIPSWCIFDNTASGAALGDAIALRSLLTP